MPKSCYFLLCCVALTFGGQQQPQSKKETTMTTYHATGPFDVKLAMQPAESNNPEISRMTLDKKFHGDLEATSLGQMLAAGKPSSSGVYVAIEIVTGVLGGRKGTFALHHTGIMEQGKPTLTVTVVPDSGTDELKGLKGSMNIRIEAGGKHFYDFDYQFAPE